MTHTVEYFVGVKRGGWARSTERWPSIAHAQDDMRRFDHLCKRSELVPLRWRVVEAGR